MGQLTAQRQRIWWLVLLVLLALPSSARASRVRMPMGHYVQGAELVVIADTSRGGERGRQTVLHIREVIKGDAKWAGQTVVLPFGPRSSADAYLPREAKGIAVLLEKGWRESKRWPVVEVFQKPPELAALRKLTPVYGLATERERLLGVRKLFAEDSAGFREQLFADLRGMQERSNFDLITGLYPSLQPPDQTRLVSLIGQIGDLRGVPTVIHALESPAAKVNSRAASVLAATFPGAPGVTEAFGKALEREHLAQEAARYLLKRRADPELERLAGTKGKTPWTKARRLAGAGEAEAAREAYLQVLQEQTTNYTACICAARWLVRSADAAERDRIRAVLLAVLAREQARHPTYYATEVAATLRALRHPECVAPLLRIIEHKSVLLNGPARVAAMALRELEPAVRQKAAARIAEMLATSPPENAALAARHMLALIWVGDSASYEVASQTMLERHKATWKTLAPLRGLPRQQDEVAFLLKLLSAPKRPSREALEWIAFRLGDVRDPRAIPALVHTMLAYRGWLVAGSAAGGLIAIGGPKVEEAMMPLLTHEDRNYTRRFAIRVLFGILGSRSLPLARRMLREKDFGLKVPALHLIGRRGTAEDIELVRPLCNYWTGDRQAHYAACTAAASLRDRHGYDLNGPIARGGSL